MLAVPSGMPQLASVLCVAVMTGPGRLGISKLPVAVQPKSSVTVTLYVPSAKSVATGPLPLGVLQT